MPDFADLLRAASGATISDKASSVDAAINQKIGNIKSVPTPEEMYRGAAAADRGINGVLNNPEVLDVVNLSTDALFEKYGPRAQQLINNYNMHGRARFNADDRSSRDLNQGLADTVTDLAVGGIGSITGIGALGLGLVNADAGNWAARKAQDISEGLQDTQSPAAKMHRRVGAVVSELNQEANSNRYEQERKTDGSFAAGLKRIGRDFLDAGKEVLKDPTQLTSTVASGAGSLLAAGPLAKGIKAVGVGAKAAMPVSVGLQEGGGAYQQAVMDAHLELAGRTDLTPEQKNQMANEAGLIAAGLTGPVAAGIGALPGMSALEAAPFKAASVKSAAGNIAKETVEEAVQSGTSQMGTNLGVRLSGSNPDRDVSQGIGEQMALGAIGGMGAAGVVQAPALAGNAVTATVGAAGRSVQAGVNALNARGDRILKGGEEAAQELDRNFFNQAAETAPVVEQAAREAVDASEITPEQKGESHAYIDRVMSKARFSDDMVDNRPDSVKAAVAGSTNIFEAMERAAEVAGNEELDPETRIDNALFLWDLSSRNEDLLDQDIPEALKNIPDGDAKNTIMGFDNVMNRIQEHPAVMQAISYALKVREQAKQALTDENINTPEAHQTMEIEARVAQTNPDQVDPETVKTILAQAEKGNVGLRPEQLKALKAADALVTGKAQIEAKAKELGFKSMDDVSEEVLSKAEELETDKKSLEAHHKGIIAAVKAGDNKIASQRLEDLALFAQHMQNKVRALNAALAAGKTNDRDAVRYLGLIPNSRGMKTRFARVNQGLWIQPTNRNSVELAQKVALEAERVATLANNLATIHPELGIGHIEINSLDPSLMGDSRKVVETYSKQKQEVPADATNDADNTVDAVSSQEKKTETKQEPTSKLDEVAEPEVETGVAEQPVDSSPELEAQPDNAPANVEASQQAPSQNATEEAPVTDEDPMAGAFPSLIGSEAEGSKVRNWFRKSFRMPKEGIISRLGERPAAYVRDAIQSAQDFFAATGSSKAERITPELTAAYERYLDMGKEMQRFMNARLQDILKSDPGLAGVLQGKESNRWRQGRALNLTEPDGKGGLRWNPQLLQASILAALQWRMVAERSMAPVTAEDLGKMLGLPEYMIDENDLIPFNSTFSEDDAKERIAAMLPKYWGVQARNDVFLSEVEGIPQSMAVELMHALKAQGLIDFPTKGEPEEHQEEVMTKIIFRDTTGKKFKEFNRISLKNQSEETVKLLSDLSALPSAIELIALVEPEEQTFVGSAPTKVPTTQLNNPMVELTTQERDMIRKANNVPSYANVPFINLLAQMGKDAFLELSGEGDLKGRRLNANHRKTLEGRNLTMGSAFDTIQNYAVEVQAEARAQAKDPAKKKLGVDEVPVFFANEVSVVGRMQTMGLNNIQSSKAMREAFQPTVSTLNMNEKKSYDAFILGLAQALGIKIHKDGRALSVRKIEDKLNGEYAPAVEVLSSWFQKGQGTFDAKSVQTIKETMGGKVAPMALNALMEYARFQQMLESDQDISAFKTGVYVEADGITNGPMMALMMYSIGQFTKGGLDLLRKGGFFLGHGRMAVDETGKAITKTYADYKGDDLYTTAGTGAKNMLQSKFREKDFGRNTKPGQHLATLMNVLEKLIPDLTVSQDKDGNVVIEIPRGSMKNPLTVTLYGSGEAGIASKVVKELLRAYYEKHSELLEDPLNMDKRAEWEILNDELSVLTESGVFTNKKSGTKFVGKFQRQGQFIGDVNKPNWSLSPTQISNLEFNVKELFVESLRGSINSVMSDTSYSTTAIRRAVQVQSIFMENVFKIEVQKMLKDAAQDPDWVPGSFPSKKMLDALYRKLAPFAAFVETGTQNFDMGGSTKAVATDPRDPKARDIEFGQGLDGSVRTPARFYAPGNAGVRGIPFMTIGPGDGQMVQNAIVSNLMERYLAIFDGINMALDRIEQDSVTINKAAADAALSNPLRAVQQSFAKFRKASDLWSIAEDPQVLSDLQRAFNDKDADMDAIIGMMGLLEQQLSDYANEIDARHEAIKAVGYTADQMAGVQAPHVVSKQFDLQDPSDDEILSALNKVYREKLSVLKGAKDNGDNISQELARYGQLDEETNTLRLDAAAMVGMIADMNIPDEQKALLKASLSKMAGVTIVAGSRNQVEAVARENGDLGKDYSTKVGGYYVPDSKVIYLFQPSAETLVHETIHAATFDAVYSYYNGGDLGANAQVKSEAIQRTEKLMDQWLKTDFPTDYMKPEAKRAFDNARAQIMADLANDDPSLGQAMALNEFMAWVLANQTLTDTAKKIRVADRLAKLARAALNAVRKLVFGRDVTVDVGNDLFSNLRFNTEILMRAEQPTTLYARNSKLILMQNRWFGENERLEGIRNAFGTLVAQHLESAPNILKTAQRKTEAVNAAMLAERVSNYFNSHGFKMDMQQKSTFQNMVAAFATSAQFDTAVLNRLHTLYDHAMSKISPEDFVTIPGDPNNEALAGARYDTLVGKGLVEKDDLGRSTLLPSFLALSVVHPALQQVLAKIDMPEAEKQSFANTDEALSSLGRRAMSSLARTLSGEKRNATDVKQAIDSMIDVLAHSVNDQENFLNQMVDKGGNIIDKGNAFLSENMSKAAVKMMDMAGDLAAKDSKAAKVGAAMLNAIGLVIDEDTAETVSKDWMASGNESEGLWPTMRNLMVELIGRTEDNASIMDRIKPTKDAISRARQQFRDHLPVKIRSKFKEALSDEQWTHLFKGVGKTDLMALKGTHQVKDIMAMLTNQTRFDGEVDKLEAKIASLDPGHSHIMLAKAKQLAHWMNTGEAGHKLLANAHAIGWLLGEVRGKSEPDADLVKAIDQLTTLYAMQGLPQTIKDSLTELVAKEPEGMEFLLSYSLGQRNSELAKLSDMALFNHYKGHVPSDRQEGSNLMVADDRDGHKLELLGYERVADYKGSRGEAGARPRGYYFTPVSGQAAYNQGILQTVRPTASGVDPITGYSYGVTVGGRITDPQMVKQIEYRLRHKEDTKEPLRPIYGTDGNVVAYERMIDPVQEELLDRDTNYADMIGAWRGRQLEEELARAFNHELVNELHAMWERDRKDSKANQYTDMFTEKDPIVKDSMKLLPIEVRNQVKELFGKDGFMVRRDMMLNTFGERSASIGDMWTGNTRWSEETQRSFQRAAIGVFGKDAYKKFVNVEQKYQGLISDAKNNIIVRSIIVPMSNLMSNMLQLAARGVPVKAILTGMVKKTSEIDTYIKSELEHIDLEAELRAAEASRDVIRARQLRTRMQAIKDDQKRMSIWPLIEAGEFTALTEDLDRDDTKLVTGRLSDYIEDKVNRLPEAIRTLGRYAYITKNTALFKGLQKAVSYGDFIAKAVLYEDMLGRQKATKEEALKKISAEYIHYDMLRGRVRQNLESMGLMWFWNYKLRSVKVAADMIRNNPLHALLANMAPVPSFLGSVGTPMTDNFFTVLADGSLGHSIGPGQALNAYTMNPWLNLTQ